METIFDKRKFDFLKVIAAICIVLSHTLPEKIFGVLDFLIRGYYWVGVFFFISGYGLSYSYKNKVDYMNHFIINKIIHIYIPFVFAEVCYIIIVKGCIFRNIDIESVCLEIVGIKLANSILWYVIEILFIYFLFYIIKKCVKSISQEKIIWILIYIIFLIVSVLFNLGTWWFISTSCFLIAYFINLGDGILLLFYKYRECAVVGSVILFVLIIAEGETELLADMTHIPQNYLLVLFQIIEIPIFVYLIIYLSRYLPNIKCTISKISYEIYLYHVIVIEIMGLCIQKLYIRVISVLIVSIIVAFVMNKLNKLLKCINKNLQLGTCNTK